MKKENGPDVFDWKASTLYWYDIAYQRMKNNKKMEMKKENYS